jgi:uncharacterized membrane protein YhaH (DUF805 family)
LTVKRLHDRNRSGYFAALFVVPLVLDLVTVIALDPANQDLLHRVAGVILLGRAIWIVIGMWLFIELFCLRGTVGPNQHGPDPVAEVPAPAR